MGLGYSSMAKRIDIEWWCYTGNAMYVVRLLCAFSDEVSQYKVLKIVQTCGDIYSRININGNNVYFDESLKFFLYEKSIVSASNGFICYIPSQFYVPINNCI